jgi:hypothetical protein
LEGEDGADDGDIFSGLADGDWRRKTEWATLEIGKKRAQSGHRFTALTNGDRKSLVQQTEK